MSSETLKCFLSVNNPRLRLPPPHLRAQEPESACLNEIWQRLIASKQYSGLFTKQKIYNKNIEKRHPPKNVRSFQKRNGLCLLASILYTLNMD